MATIVGTVTLSGCKYSLGYDLLSQSSSTNSSVVRLYGILEVTNNYVSWSRGSASVHTSGLAAIGTYYARGTHVVISRDFTWTHDANGNFSVWIGASLSTTFVSGDTGGVITLPSIARKITTTSAPDFNDETSSISVTFNNPKNFQSRPYINFYLGQSPSTYSLRLERPKALRTSPFTWEFTAEEQQQMRETLANYSRAIVSIGFDTFEGDTNIGYSSLQRNFTIVNANPTFDLAYQDTNTTATAITQDDQQIIQNISTLQINLTNVTALKEATLSSATVNINGTNYNASSVGSSITFDIGTLNLSNNVNAQVSVTDSRGNTTTTALPLTILEYSNPTGLVSLARQNNFYSETDIKVDANYSSLDNKNVVIIKTRYKKVTEQNYGSYVNLTNNTTTTLTLDNSYQWDVQVLVTDSVGGSTTYNLTIDRGFPIVFYDRIKRSVGINSFPQNNESLDILGGDLLNVLGTRTNTWTSGNTYRKGDVVTYERNLYKNLTGTNSTEPDADTTNWASTSFLENLLNFTKGSNYLTFGNIGVCWGQAHPTYANANVLLANNVSLPLSFSNGRCIASTVNYNNLGSELDAIAKVPSAVSGNTMNLALHSVTGKFTSSSNSFYINYLVIGTLN